jgi:hypothetical protein
LAPAAVTQLDTAITITSFYPSHPESIEWFIEDPALSLSYDLAPLTYSPSPEKVASLYVPASYITVCTFQISVDFYYVPVGGRGKGREGGARMYPVWVQLVC